MYEIRRNDGRVTVTRQTGGRVVTILNAAEDAYVLYKESNGAPRAAMVRDLPDSNLLTALASAVDLKGLTH